VELDPEEKSLIDQLSGKEVIDVLALRAIPEDFGRKDLNRKKDRGKW